MNSTFANSISTKDILRHSVSIILLFAAWKILRRWYFFQHPSDYFFFLLLAVTGFLLAAAKFLLSEIQKIPGKRLLFCLPLLILLLPWGEWLSLGTIFTRESWTEQLFKQALFIYGCFSLLTIFPGFALKLQNVFLNILEVATKERLLIWSAPVFLFILTGWIALFVYKETPVVQDSAAHLFQAHIFKHFQIYAPAPTSVQESFTGPLDLLVMKDTKWFGMYSPGYAALMAPAAVINLEWLVSPVLAALTCAIWILYAQRWHGKRTAMLVGWLIAFSPFIIVMSSTVMVFTPELFFASIVIFLLRFSLENTALTALMGLILGISGGILARSFSFFPFLIPMIAYAFFAAIAKKRFAILISMFFGFAGGITLLLLFQWITTGNPLTTPYELELPVAMGFKEHFIGTHTLSKGIDNLSNNLLGLNHWIGGWYSGTLIFVLVFFLKQRSQLWDRLFIAACFFLIIFYFFFFFQDLFFGPRFFYSFTPILLLFTARSVTERSIPFKAEVQPLISFFVLTLVISVPLTLPGFIKRYDPSKTQSGKLKEEIRKMNGQPTLVFLDKGAGQNFVNWNDPFLKSNVILARDLKEHNAEVEKLFPGYKPVWFRMTSSFEKAKMTGGFRFVSEPDRSPSGSLNLFDLAMALQAPRNYPKQDFFDICYIDVFDFGSGNEQYQFLEQEEQEPLTGREYKRNFRKGIIHAGKMMLLPIIAFEEFKDDWKTHLDTSNFKSEFKMAQIAFENAGEVGQPILAQMDKVNRRIDSNSDQQLSDSEIHMYLTEKIKLIRMGASL